MRYTLQLECIGDNHLQEMRRYLGSSGGVPFPWVAKIVGIDDLSLRFERKFLRGQKDYSEGNSVGSRGIFLYFWLEPGLYDVFSRETWKRSRRYFLLVNEDATTRELTKEEAILWARENCWEPMY